MEEMLNSNGLILINSYMCFTPEERKKLEESFEKNDMEIFFIEQRGINNSIFDGIEIILNNNLFNMLVGGVLMPAAYDILKNSLVVIVKKIKNSNVKFLRANKDPEPINAVIKIKTDVGEIIASIDQELTPEEVAHKIASNTLDNKNQYFIVDKTSDGELEVLLLSEYLKKHNKI
jgi:hypothetical protein